MNTATENAATSTPIPPGVVRLIKLKKEGALSMGDTIATSRLGECIVVAIQDRNSLSVRRLANDQYYVLSGLSFGRDARVVSA